jgi:hypothetical protein
MVHVDLLAARDDQELTGERAKDRCGLGRAVREQHEPAHALQQPLDSPR